MRLAMSLRTRWGKQRGARIKARPRRRSLFLEPLEDRLTLSTAPVVSPAASYGAVVGPNTLPVFISVPNSDPTAYVQPNQVASIQVNPGDGSPVQTEGPNGPGGSGVYGVQVAYAHPGTCTLSVRALSTGDTYLAGGFFSPFPVTEPGSWSNWASTTVQVQGTPPQLVGANLPSSVFTGSPFTLHLSAQENAASPVKVTVSWGDGTSSTYDYPADPLGPNPGVRSWDFTRSYAQPGNYTVTYSLADQWNDVGSGTLGTVIVSDRPPPTTTGIADVTVIRDAAPTALNLFNSFSDPTYPDTSLTFSVVADSNPALVQASITPGNPSLLTLAYAPGGVGNSTLTVRATNPDGLSVDTTFTATVLGPDLLGTSFQVLNPVAYWNGPADIAYTIANQGAASAGAFNVEVRASDDPVIDSSDALLTTFRVQGIAAGGSVSGRLTVTMPGNTAPGQEYLGLIIDPANEVAEADKSNNSNQGPGLDLAAVTVPGIQAVEPDNTFATPNVIAPTSVNVGAITAPGDVDYYIFNLPSDGQLTVNVTAAPGSSLDPKASLYDGGSQEGLMFVSDDRAPGNRSASLSPYLGGPFYPFLSAPTLYFGGTYVLAVSASAAARGAEAVGAYTLSVSFTPTGGLPVQTPQFMAGPSPTATIAADLNGDGVPDLVTANADDTLSILTGEGNGTFLPQTVVNLDNPGDPPKGPAALVSGDFNGDGRTDLAVVNSLTGTVTVLLGVGNGTFPVQQRHDYAVGSDPVALVSGDFNGDGRTDLAVLNQGSDTVSILLGNGDGTFTPGATLATGSNPSGLVVADFNGDGKLDLATANQDDNTVSVFLGNGDGTFGPATAYAVGTTPRDLIVRDFNQDGHPDLAVADSGSGDVMVLLGNGDGTFTAQAPVAVGISPQKLVAGNFAGGPNSLVVEGNSGQTLTLLSDNGDGTFDGGSYPFDAPYPLVVGGTTVLAADLNADGHDDLVYTEASGAVVPLLSTDLAPVPSLDTTILAGSLLDPGVPVVADVNGDGVPDYLVLGQQGQILLRPGLPGDGSFAAPILVNPNDPAIGMTLLPGAHPMLAAIDRSGQTVSLYSFGANFQPTLAGHLDLGAPAVAIAAGDLNGDGLPDLVVAEVGVTAGTLASGVSVYLATPGGGFGVPQNIYTGEGPSSVTLADVEGTGRPDILVTNRISGDVAVLSNLGGGNFAPMERFRAGNGPYQASIPTLGTVEPPPLAVQSQEGTAGLVVGDFTGDGTPDLVTINSTSNTFSLLVGKGNGEFVDPISFATGPTPIVVRAGDFNGDGNLDLAILTRGDDTISIYLGDGHGHFTLKSTADAGNSPDGLTVQPVTAGGKPSLDLLVGNTFGDILRLVGNGDGTFRQYQRLDPNIALAVGNLQGKSQDDFVYGNAAMDHVSVQYGSGPAGVFQDRQNGIQAPGAVQLADLNGDGIPDLVVLNSGANDVLVYLGLGNGQFGSAQTFYTGTTPTGLTVADLNGDGIPDLVVADAGSNDLTVLFGKGQGSNWTLTTGPRLLTGGAGPVSTTVRDVNGDGIPDILVANSVTNDVTLIPGLGGGFFDDRSPRVFNTGSDPQQVLVGDFNGDGSLDLVTLNYTSNDLTFYSNFESAQSVATTISAGGEGPITATARDVNGDGTADLIVADNASGTVSLFLGDATGLSLAETLAAPGDPTALAESAVDGNPLSIYVADAGSETATLLTFTLDSTLLPAFEAVPGTGVQRPQTTDLQSLNESSLAVIATLVTDSGESEMTQVITIEIGEAVGPGFAAEGGQGGAGGAAGSEGVTMTRLSGLVSLLVGAEEESLSGADQAADDADPDRLLNKFLLGVDPAHPPAPAGREAPADPAGGARRTDDAGEALPGPSGPAAAGWTGAQLTVTVVTPAVDPALPASVFGPQLRAPGGFMPGVWSRLADPLRPPVAVEEPDTIPAPREEVPAEAQRLEDPGAAVVAGPLDRPLSETTFEPPAAPDERALDILFASDGWRPLPEAVPVGEEGAHDQALSVPLAAVLFAAGVGWGRWTNRPEGRPSFHDDPNRRAADRLRDARSR